MASPSMSVSTPPNRDTAPVVSVRGVAHTYGTTRALDALDLDIPAGCMVGIVGPDGVGKSTLMGLIAGSKKMQDGHGHASSAATWPSAAPPRRRLPAHRLHAAGPGQEPLPRAQRLRQRRLHGAGSSGCRPTRARRPHQRAARRHGPGPVPRPPRRQALGRHEAEGRALRRAGPRPGPAHPRRADHRRRSALAAAVLDAHRRHPRRAARHERRSSPPPTWTRPSSGTGSSRWTPAACSRPARPPSSWSARAPTNLEDALHRAAAGGEAQGPHASSSIPPRVDRQGGDRHRGHGPDPALRHLHRRRPRHAVASSAARSSASSAPTAAASPRR